MCLCEPEKKTTKVLDIFYTYDHSICFVGLGLTALLDNISVYIGPSPKGGRKKINEGKISKQPAPIASAIGPYLLLLKLVGRPGTGS